MNCKSSGLIYSADESLFQIEKMLSQMSQFKALSKDLVQMMEYACNTSKWATYFGEYALSFFKNAEGSPAEWESRIFVELVKENVKLVLDK